MRCNRPLFAAKNAFKCREICAKLGEGLAGLRTETRGVISNSEGPYIPKGGFGFFGQKIATT
jgi:hypothetical protein